MKKSFENLYTFFFCFLPNLMLTSLFSNIVSSWSQATRALSFSVNSFANSLNFIFSYSAFTLLIMTIIFKNYFLECVFLHSPFMQNSLLDWRRQWQPTPVLLPGKSHGWRSLIGYSPWSHEELNMTEASLSLFTFMHWTRKWQQTPVFLPGESQGQRSLVGCRLWSCTESDTTEAT